MQHEVGVFVGIDECADVATLAQFVCNRPLADVLQFACGVEVGILELLDALAPLLLQRKTAVAQCYALLIELCLALLQFMDLAVDGLVSFFNRAIVHSHLNRPVESLSDFDHSIRLDSTNSLAYFNRAIVRSQIGDYNRALEDYNKVAYYTPDNVLVYYNRALLHTQLGNLKAALGDYNRAIDLYPDFANAYINRSNIRYMLRDTKGARQDRQTADRKIAEYRSKLKDSVSYSIYSDTTHRFDQLLSFDTKMAGSNFERITTYTSGDNLALMPLFRFTLTRADSVQQIDPKRYYLQRVEDFVAQLNQPDLKLSRRECDIPIDSLVEFDSRLAERIAANINDWKPLFLRGITQSLIKQYTNAVTTYTAAIEQAPSNPFLYLHKSLTSPIRRAALRVNARGGGVYGQPSRSDFGRRRARP